MSSRLTTVSNDYKPQHLTEGKNSIMQNGANSLLEEEEPLLIYTAQDSPLQMQKAVCYQWEP